MSLVPEISWKHEHYNHWLCSAFVQIPSEGIFHQSFFFLKKIVLQQFRNKITKLYQCNSFIHN